MSFYEDAKGAAALGASSGGGGGTDNYEELNNLPEINGVTLAGNKSSSDLGLQGVIEDLSDIRSGAGAGATAVQTIKIGNETQTKTSGVVALPAYPTTLPASDTTSTYSASGTAPVNGTAVASAISGKQDTISDLSSIRSGAEAGATAVQTIQINGATQTKTSGTVNLPAYPTTLPASDTVSTYSATGTAPVNGTAVAAALGTLDVASAGGSGKYISAISETDGKISATAETMDTVPTASSTKAVTSGGIHTPIAALVNGGAKNKLEVTLASIKAANTPGSWSGNAYTWRGITFTINSDLTITVTGENEGNNDCWLYLGDAKNYSGCVMSGCPVGGSLTTYELQTASNTVRDFGEGVEITSTTPTRIAIIIRAGYNPDGYNPDGLIFKPMICSTSDWNISHDYVQYCPSLYELYQMILNAQ